MKLTSRFCRSVSLAIQLHSEQVRKGNGSPYIAHLLAVASLVVENGGSEDEAIAALLHDAVEDQGGLRTLQKIRSEFGDNVASIVAECSDSFETPRPPWRGRKEAYIASIPEKSASAKTVSLADAIHNAQALLNDFRAFGPELWDRFDGGYEGTLWYYKALAQEFTRHGPQSLARQLCFIIAELDTAIAARTAE